MTDESDKKRKAASELPMREATKSVLFAKIDVDSDETPTLKKGVRSVKARSHGGRRKKQIANEFPPDIVQTVRLALFEQTETLQCGANLVRNLTAQNLIPPESIARELMDVIKSFHYKNPLRTTFAGLYASALVSASARLVRQNGSAIFGPSSWDDVEVLLSQSTDRAVASAGIRLTHELQAAACGAKLLSHLLKTELLDFNMSSTDFDFNSEPLRAKPTVAVLKNQGLSNVLKTATRHATKCLVRHAKFLFDSDIDMPPSSHPNHSACCAAEAKTCLDNLGSVICYTAWLLCAKERVSIEHNSAAFVIRDAFLSELSLCDDILPKTTSKTKKKMFITKLKLRFLLSLLEEFAFPLQDMVASLIELEVELDSFDEEVAKQESDDVPEVVDVDCGSANQLVRKSSVPILVQRQNELVEAYELEHKDSSLFWVEYVSDGKCEAVCSDRIFRGRKRKPRPITQDDTHAARKKTQLSSGFPKSASMTTPVPSAAAAGQPIYRSLPTQRDASTSLGVLCQSFMELHKDAPPNRDNNGAVINVVEVADLLEVKRRRIFKFFSILESIDIVARVSKHTYSWHGTGDLPKFFAKLQRDAIEEQTRKANGAWAEDPNKPKTKGVGTTCHKLLQIFLSTGQFDFTLAYAADIITGPAAQATEEAARAAERNPNPLSRLPLPVDLAGLPPLEAPMIPDNDAATTTDGKTPTQTAMKTNNVSRHIYDIVNVLQALGVLTKYSAGSTNKTSLKWTFYLKPDEIAQYGASSQPPLQRNPNNPVAIANSRLTLDNDSESSPSRRTESSKTAPLGCERTPTPTPRTRRAFNGDESFDPMPSNKNFSSDGGRKYSMRGDQMPFPPAGSPPQMPGTPKCHSRTTGTELRSVYEKSSQKDKYTISQMLLKSVTKEGAREKGQVGEWHQVIGNGARMKASQTLLDARFSHNDRNQTLDNCSKPEDESSNKKIASVSIPSRLENGQSSKIDISGLDKLPHDEVIAAAQGTDMMQVPNLFATSQDAPPEQLMPQQGPHQQRNHQELDKRVTTGHVSCPIEIRVQQLLQEEPRNELQRQLQLRHNQLQQQKLQEQQKFGPNSPNPFAATQVDNSGLGKLTHDEVTATDMMIESFISCNHVENAGCNSSEPEGETINCAIATVTNPTHLEDGQSSKFDISGQGKLSSALKAHPFADVPATNIQARQFLQQHHLLQQQQEHRQHQQNNNSLDVYQDALQMRFTPHQNQHKQQHTDLGFNLTLQQSLAIEYNQLAPATDMMQVPNPFTTYQEATQEQLTPQQNPQRQQNYRQLDFTFPENTPIEGESWQSCRYCQQSFYTAAGGLSRHEVSCPTKIQVQQPLQQLLHNQLEEQLHQHEQSFAPYLPTPFVATQDATSSLAGLGFNLTSQQSLAMEYNQLAPATDMMQVPNPFTTYQEATQEQLTPQQNPQRQQNYQQLDKHMATVTSFLEKNSIGTEFWQSCRYCQQSFFIAPDGLSRHEVSCPAKIKVQQFFQQEPRNELQHNQLQGQFQLQQQEQNFVSYLPTPFPFAPTYEPQQQQNQAQLLGTSPFALTYANPHLINHSPGARRPLPLGCERAPSPTPGACRTLFRDESFDPRPSNHNFSLGGGRQDTMRGDQMPLPPAYYNGAPCPPQISMTPNHSRTTGTQSAWMLPPQVYKRAPPRPSKTLNPRFNSNL